MSGMPTFVRRNIALRANDRLDQVAELLASGDDEIAVRAREHLAVLYLAVRAVLESHTADPDGRCAGCATTRRWWSRRARYPCVIRRQTLWILGNKPPGSAASPVRWGTGR